MIWLLCPTLYNPWKINTFQFMKYTDYFPKDKFTFVFLFQNYPLHDLKLFTSAKPHIKYFISDSEFWDNNKCRLTIPRTVSEVRDDLYQRSKRSFFKRGDFVVHIEDDFEFFEDSYKDYLKATEILRDNPDIATVKVTSNKGSDILDDPNEFLWMSCGIVHRVVDEIYDDEIKSMHMRGDDRAIHFHLLDQSKNCHYKTLGGAHILHHANLDYDNNKFTYSYDNPISLYYKNKYKISDIDYHGTLVKDLSLLLVRGMLKYKESLDE